MRLNGFFRCTKAAHEALVSAGVPVARAAGWSDTNPNSGGYSYVGDVPADVAARLTVTTVAASRWGRAHDLVEIAGDPDPKPMLVDYAGRVHWTWEAYEAAEAAGRLSRKIT